MSRRLQGRDPVKLGTMCLTNGEMVAGTQNLNGARHVVQFYGHDRELAERAADFLLGGLDHGVAIVIATAEHRREFEARLAEAGVDLAAAREDGTYLDLDAARTLRGLMAADRLDGAAFDRVIGTLITRSGAGGRPVRAYGEMVALLWDDGLVNDAVQLERMWEELGNRQQFSLFCAYRADSVTGEVDALAEVCRLHGRIVGPKPGVPDAARTFAFTHDAPALARHFAVATLRGWGAGDLEGDAALVVTELATNAILHAHTAFTVILSARDDVLRISVRDTGPLRVPELRPTPLHGLGAVDAMASRWGVESLGTAGKTVWVDLPR
jgi:MEDS: MEthanogen/methylotroph, DcmR Sensory domain